MKQYVQAMLLELLAVARQQAFSVCITSNNSRSTAIMNASSISSGHCIQREILEKSYNLFYEFAFLLQLDIWRDHFEGYCTGKKYEHVCTKLHGVVSQKTVIFSEGMQVQIYGNSMVNNVCVNEGRNGWNEPNYHSHYGS
jgi:hypothetical protein